MTRTWNTWTHDWDDRSGELTRWQDEPQPLWEKEDRQNGKPAKGRLECAFEDSQVRKLKRAMDLSDVRMERVERIRKQLQEGTYLVPSRELAEKLIRSMLGEY
jgi:anti-sigma28 factor (negative regulator of flagellin synthesis)